MPRLSDSMEEGTVLAWIKAVGDSVQVGDELVEIETDKANMVFEADAAGTLIEIVAAEGETLPIGSVIARVGSADEAQAASGENGEAPGGGSAIHASAPPRVHAGDTPIDAPVFTAPRPTDSTETPAATGAFTSPAQPQAAPGENGRTKASPLARRIARQRGIDLSSLSGSGPGGRIIKADVEGAPVIAPAQAEAAAVATASTAPALTPESAKGAVQVVEPTKIQRTIARRMAESKATAPHFYLQAQIDMSRAFKARAQVKASAGEGELVPSFNDMVVKACALALREFPRANGSYRDGRFELYERVNVGVAVAGPDVLIVPTIFDADRKGLRQIAAETRALAAKVRDQTITPPELSGATFTVSNLGMYGVFNFHPVINLPQAAILAVGAITATPVIRDGELATAQVMGVTLACDHRILYGADAAQLLARVRSLLEEPLGLAL
jgi:pyruvate dehydrogenase E2 component (dihydrolipoyllysine-residue acetyltransferase)